MLFILIHIKTKEVITDIVEEEKRKNNANLMIEAVFFSYGIFFGKFREYFFNT